VAFVVASIKAPRSSSKRRFLELVEVNVSVTVAFTVANVKTYYNSKRRRCLELAKARLYAIINISIEIILLRLLLL